MTQEFRGSIITMVEILCPHCEGEIELDDDAKGEFACPLCDGEFEWGVEEDELDFLEATSVNNVNNMILTENPVIRITAGVIFCVAMAIYIVSSLFILGAGLFVSEVEGAIDSDTSFGMIIVLVGFLMLFYHITGLTFGVLLAKGRFSALIVCTAMSATSLIGTFVSWMMSEGECLEYDWEFECTNYESVSPPIAGFILWFLMLGMMLSMIFVPQFRYQYE